MSWASRRQFRYALGLFVFLGLVLFAFLYPVIFRKPTCTDNRQNGTETGVDCGGSCSRVCDKDVSNPVILWSRAFHVVKSDYNLVALVENRNKNFAVETASYEFRIYDTNNKLLGRREGSTFIPPNQQFAVFEPRFDAGISQIKSVSFEFLPTPIWVTRLPTVQTLPINVTDIVYDNNPNTPSLSAIVRNNSIYNIPEFDVVAILYDADHNAINASATHRNSLPSDGSALVTFTWPEAISAFPVTKDILVSINPFSVPF